MLTGPVKSGKTDVLHLVLPSLIAREHSSRSRRPLILRFTFDLRQGPEIAAATLLDTVKAAAAPMGIAVQLEYAPGWALRNMARVLAGFANALVEMHAELWFLMDECQVSAAGVSSGLYLLSTCFCHSSTSLFFSFAGAPA